MRKFIITAELRDLEMQVLNEGITYSRMIELLNQKAEKWHRERFKEMILKELKNRT